MSEIISLHDKLVMIQSEISVPKSKYNEFGKYKYRESDDIIKALNPFLKKLNVTITIDDDIVQIGTRIYVKSTATLSDGASAISKSSFAREPEVKKGMDESQITGTASSYAGKKALSGLLGLNGSPDADSTNNEADEIRPTKKKTSNDIGDTVIPYGANEGLTFREVSTKDLLDLCAKIVKVNKEDGTEIPSEEKEFMATVKKYLRGDKK